MKYSESGIEKKILKGLEEMGFVDMTPIQELTIPVLTEGKDVIGQAQTGTGKTAAFAIPMIEMLDPEETGVQGIILCPTRELAIQAADEITKMAKYVKTAKVLPVYGGQDIEKQIRALKKHVSIIVGTPGRVMDHMRRKTLKLGNIKMLVLDEADEMLNMGFREDIETICQSLPQDRQTALFSATMAKEIMEITDNYQRDAVVLKAAQEELTIPLVKQYHYVVRRDEKDASLCRLIDYMAPKRALIFANTKRKVDQLTLMLKGKGYAAEALHGDLSQHQRDRVMNLFRTGKLELLLATDVAARGIDVDDVDMVFNYDMPQDMEYYVHRIGRTGRAGRKGKAISIITNREKYKIDSLEEYCNTDITKKEMPTVASAQTAKAYRNLDSALEYCTEMDLTPYMKIVYKRCVDEGMDPLQAAAAFLRMSMGELEEEHKQESHGRRREKRGDRHGDHYKGSVPGSRRTRDRKEKSEGKGNGNGKRSKNSNKNRRSDSGRKRSGKK